MKRLQTRDVTPPTMLQKLHLAIDLISYILELWK
jgi:hypothetical protein